MFQFGLLVNEQFEKDSVEKSRSARRRLENPLCGWWIVDPGLPRTCCWDCDSCSFSTPCIWSLNNKCVFKSVWILTEHSNLYMKRLSSVILWTWKNFNVNSNLGCVAIFCFSILRSWRLYGRCFSTATSIFMVWKLRFRVQESIWCARVILKQAHVWLQWLRLSSSCHLLKCIAILCAFAAEKLQNELMQSGNFVESR